MDISKTKQLSSSSNLYDDLRNFNSLSCGKKSPRSTSTIEYVSPYRVEGSQVKRPTVSLILPAPTTSDTIVSIDDTKQSSLNELENKDQNSVIEVNDYSCICWIVWKMIELISIALFTCLIGMFIFTILFCVFDTYWLEQPVINNSSWWW
ncbi:unnamed protein product [Adineta steineri]|uniref:Uncharacterized protein n=1 Tax=Adineta steineri TaxID=433720 RepID=A0A813M6K8_9BILA|nr:unnamed protein product [Adineta steineri]CAF0744092.1 unnamed protein product [Adineta steineri]CAF3883854.1 unnamed protein product [Adineta steineri]CAF3917056.1 unnamed protein product [Adineta steineri]